MSIAETKAGQVERSAEQIGGLLEGMLEGAKPLTREEQQQVNCLKAWLKIIRPEKVTKKDTPLSFMRWANRRAREELWPDFYDYFRIAFERSDRRVRVYLQAEAEFVNQHRAERNRAAFEAEWGEMAAQEQLYIQEAWEPCEEDELSPAQRKNLPRITSAQPRRQVRGRGKSKGVNLGGRQK
jgi:hypothetical protein